MIQGRGHKQDMTKGDIIVSLPYLPDTEILLIYVIIFNLNLRGNHSDHSTSILRPESLITNQLGPVLDDVGHDVLSTLLGS